MTEISEDENTRQRCGECGGVWLDNTDLTRILLHNNLPALTAMGGRANVEEMAGMCPSCNVDLVVVEGGERHSLHYDTCESCGGIWLEPQDEEANVPQSMEWKEIEGSLVGFYRRFKSR
jgi:Zn-finger nucleic acid-binding protein